MPPKRSKPITGERHIFLINTEGDTKTWADIERDPVSRMANLVGDKIGPHSNLVSRAERRVLVMNNIAHRNMLLGFGVAVHDERYKEPIWERYMDKTPLVRERSRAKTDRLLDFAGRNFYKATGFEALRGSGITRGEVRGRLSKMWRDFNSAYGGPMKVKKRDENGHLVLDESGQLIIEEDKRRNNYRKLQKQRLPADHKLRKVKKRKGQQAEERIAA